MLLSPCGNYFRTVCDAVIIIPHKSPEKMASNFTFEAHGKPLTLDYGHFVVVVDGSIKINGRLILNLHEYESAWTMLKGARKGASWCNMFIESFHYLLLTYKKMYFYTSFIPLMT